MKLWRVHLDNQWRQETAVLLVNAQDLDAARREAGRKLGQEWEVTAVREEVTQVREVRVIQRVAAKDDDDFKWSRVLMGLLIVGFLFVAAVFICGGLADMRQR
jgi:hypothetical protein